MVQQQWITILVLLTIHTCAAVQQPDYPSDTLPCASNKKSMKSQEAARPAFFPSLAREVMPRAAGQQCVVMVVVVDDDVSWRLRGTALKMHVHWLCFQSQLCLASVIIIKCERVFGAAYGTRPSFTDLPQ